MLIFSTHKIQFSVKIVITLIISIIIMVMCAISCFLVTPVNKINCSTFEILPDVFLFCDNKMIFYAKDVSSLRALAVSERGKSLDAKVLKDI